MLAGIVQAGEGAGGPEMRMFILPRADVKVLDTWHVDGNPTNNWIQFDGTFSSMNVGGCQVDQFTGADFPFDFTRRFGADYTTTAVVDQYFTVYGNPEPKGAWGVSIEGHHLSLNMTFDGDRVVDSTPHFFGVNPAKLKRDFQTPDPMQSGSKTKYVAGNRLLLPEEGAAYALLSTLTEEQKVQFAMEAIGIRYENGKSVVDAHQLLVPKRLEDNGNDLWSVLNTIQEKLVHGDFYAKRPNSSRVRKARPIKNFKKDIELNEKLFKLAYQYI
jgi:hypothetical protein